MIRVNVELLPYGDKDNATHLKTLLIENVDGKNVSTYKYQIIGGEGDHDGCTRYYEASGVVKHKRDKGVLELVRKVLKDIKSLK